MDLVYKKRREQALHASTDNDKWLLWTSALVFHNLTIEETLIRENMDYLLQTREQILQSWGEKGSKKIKEKWIKDNPKSKEEIIDYYNNLDLYIPELSSWHAIEKNEDLMHIVQFLIFAIKQQGKTYLDFGSGIGTSGIFFHYYGFKVTLADISDSMLKYEKWRLQQRHIHATIIDLKKQTVPNESFDCATCIEVLEHIPDPVAEMEKIRLALKPRGYVLITTPFFKDDERPQHIIHDMSIVEEFNKLGFEEHFVSSNNIYRILKRIK